MRNEKTGEGYRNGEVICVKHVVTPNLPSRQVTFEEQHGNPGIRVNNHWFRWGFFFEVNFIVMETYTNILNNYLSGNTTQRKRNAICDIRALKTEHLVPFVKDMLLKMNDCNKTYYNDTYEAAKNLHEMVLSEIEHRLKPVLERNRETVLDKYPDAVVVNLVDYGYAIWKQGNWCEGVRVSDRCKTLEEAWESAAHRLIC